MQEWREIEDFPGYSVSSHGKIRNDYTDRILSLDRNQSGIVYVGLSRGGVQYKRSVALLVAKAFLPDDYTGVFNTPINLDGDKTNNRVENLAWRPRWFAIKYFKQFNDHHRGFIVPIREIHSGEEFPNSFAAATKYGLLDHEILVATMNRTYVWPTYQEFRVIEE